jgi:hypothetical protein
MHSSLLRIWSYSLLHVIIHVGLALLNVASINIYSDLDHPSSWWCSLSLSSSLWSHGFSWSIDSMHGAAGGASVYRGQRRRIGTKSQLAVCRATGKRKEFGLTPPHVSKSHRLSTILPCMHPFRHHLASQRPLPSYVPDPSSKKPRSIFNKNYITNFFFGTISTHTRHTSACILFDQVTLALPLNW